MSTTLEAALGRKARYFVIHMRILESVGTRRRFGGQWILLDKGKLVHSDNSAQGCANFATKNGLTDALRAFVEPLSVKRITTGGANMSEDKKCKLVEYVALVHKEADSDFGVSFPSVPGCVTASEHIDEAFELSEEALGAHLQDIVDRGEKLPSSQLFRDLKLPAVRRFLVGVVLHVPCASNDSSITR